MPSPEREPPQSLAGTLNRLAPADIVVVEGYKRESIPKIEVRRQAAAQTDPMAPGDPNIIAVAANQADDLAGVPTSVSTMSVQLQTSSSSVLAWGSQPHACSHYSEGIFLG